MSLASYPNHDILIHKIHTFTTLRIIQHTLWVGVTIVPY